MRNLLVLWLAFSGSQLLASDFECELSAEVVGAHYARSVADTDGTQANTSTLTLWRYQRRVAHQYAEAGRTDAWARVADNRIQLTRLFDADHRGIEYEAELVADGLEDAVWQIRSQLVTADQIAQLELIDTTGTGCAVVETYAGRWGDNQVQLEWLPNRDLVKRYSVSSTSRVIEVVLQSTTDNVDAVVAQFSLRDSYKLTDNADIGDNETDPFLQRMINLGFAESHSSARDTHTH